MTTTETVEPWSAEEARNHAQTALQCLTHDCGGSRLVEMRENCGACALGGYAPSKDREAQRDRRVNGPNYAGWARIYTEARLRVPRIWHAAFERELSSDNVAHVHALRRSIATFGDPRRTFAERL